jgi:hypothetical protein
VCGTAAVYDIDGAGEEISGGRAQERDDNELINNPTLETAHESREWGGGRGTDRQKHSLIRTLAAMRQE